MCRKCNYSELLCASNLEANENRLRVLEVIGNNQYPISATNIFKILGQATSINRVTVYRILDLLVDHDIIERISTGGRAFYYGLAPNDFHKPHHHFYCKSCGQMDCLDPGILEVDTGPLLKTIPGQIDKIEIRIDGICKNCLQVLSGTK